MTTSVRTSAAVAETLPTYLYRIYGVRITSDRAFEFQPATGREPALADVEFLHGTEQDFPAAPAFTDPADVEFTCQVLADHSTHVRWPNLYEFKVAGDGTRVLCRALGGDNNGAVLQNFLFGQALSFALVRQGLEPYHASVVGIEDCAVGFLGDCSFGKSTLLASFLQAGYRLLTDDLLIVERDSGCPVALPGSGRIKLMPESAAAFLAGSDTGTCLIPGTRKRSFRVEEVSVQRTALPLKQLFVLPAPEERSRTTAIEIRPLTRTALLRELLKNSFNVEVLEPERLVRQFERAADLASMVDGFALHYPVGLQHLPTVRRRVIEHLSRTLHGRHIQ